jgi:hypothetical protein
MEQDIREYARSYSGTFDFMNAMKQRVERGWPLTPGMVGAIERCRQRDNAQHALFVGAPSNKPTGLDLSVLPGGSTYHAVKNSEGTLTFLRVDNVNKSSSRWFKWIFVKHLIGGDREDRIGKQRPGDSYVGTMVGMLGKVLHDPEASMARYGIEFGHCGRCGRSLTDEESRTRGIGPECWKNMRAAA